MAYNFLMILIIDYWLSIVEKLMIKKLIAETKSVLIRSTTK